MSICLFGDLREIFETYLCFPRFLNTPITVEPQLSDFVAEFR